MYTCLHETIQATLTIWINLPSDILNMQLYYFLLQ